MMKVGRNDPCPCGSGDKYKKCCLSEEPGPNARGLAAEAIADISEEFKGRRFGSLEEANAAAREITARRNSTALKEFSGLSPEQMFRFLHFPFESPDLVRFAEVFTAPKEAPVLNLFALLAEAMGTDGLPATAKGNLPRNFCKEAHRQVLKALPRDSASSSHFFKMSSEEDFLELHLTRLAAGLAGLLRRQRGRFLLTAKGREAATDTTGCLAYAALFRASALKLNWGFFDGYPPYRIVQTAFLYSLYLLSRHGDDYRTEDFYGELFLLAFPAVLDEAPPDAYFGPRDQVMMCHGLRTFARFAVLFGLAETRPDPGGKRLSRIEFRKTTVLDDFVRFDV